MRLKAQIGRFSSLLITAGLLFTACSGVTSQPQPTNIPVSPTVIMGKPDVAPAAETSLEPSAEKPLEPSISPSIQVTETPGEITKVIRFGTGRTGTDLFPYHQIIQEFEELNPDILIQVEPMAGTDYYSRLIQLNEAGKAPDIINLSDDKLLLFVENGILAEFSGAEIADEFDLSTYFPGLLEPGRVNGRQYLLPEDFSPLALYYNKILFKNAGVEYPSDDWTWDDLLKAARRLTVDRNSDGKPEQWGIQMNANWDMGFEYWVATAGGTLISEDGRKFTGYMDSPETIRAASFYSSLYHTEKVAPPPADLFAWMGGNMEFAEGKAAMVISGYWDEAEFLQNPAIDLGIAAPPRDKVRGNILFWSGSGMTTASENPASVKKFLAYAYGPQSSLVWKDWHLPIHKSIINDEGFSSDPLYKIWYQELNFVKPRGYSRTPFWEETARPVLLNALEILSTDPSTDPAQLMRQAAQKAQAALDELLLEKK